MSNFFWRLSFESDINTKSSAYNRQDIFVPSKLTDSDFSSSILGKSFINNLNKLGLIHPLDELLPSM